MLMPLPTRPRSDLVRPLSSARPQSQHWVKHRLPIGRKRFSLAGRMDGPTANLF